MFVQLGAIPKTRSKFIEIVTVVERYLVITRVKKKRIKEAAVANMTSYSNMP